MQCATAHEQLRDMWPNLATKLGTELAIVISNNGSDGNFTACNIGDVKGNQPPLLILAKSRVVQTLWRRWQSAEYLIKKQNTCKKQANRKSKIKDKSKNNNKTHLQHVQPQPRKREVEENTCECKQRKEENSHSWQTRGKWEQKTTEECCWTWSQQHVAKSACSRKRCVCELLLLLLIMRQLSGKESEAKVKKL